MEEVVGRHDVHHQYRDPRFIVYLGIDGERMTECHR